MDTSYWGKGLVSGLYGVVRLLALACLMAGAASSALATKTYTDNGDGTVTDSTTGLIWMRCAVGQTWTGSTCIGYATNYPWNQVNLLSGTVSFAGQNDWRVPNIRELTMIVDRSRENPSIDPTAFPNTSASNFWSTSADAYLSADYAWSVDFSAGHVSQGGKSGAFQVRLVRAGQSFAALLNLARPTPDYVDHGDGTVTHTPSGLIWQRCSKGQSWTGSTCTGSTTFHTWYEAVTMTDSFAGQLDWRLPSVYELESLVDYTMANPALNATVFPATPTGWSFWSASAHASGSGGAWHVAFGSGGTYGNYDKTGAYRVRFVRAGPSEGTSVSLSLTKSGTGTGTVTSSTAGINCGTTCSASYTSGTIVILNATPAAGSTFTGWSGACSGTDSCTVGMTEARSVTATFTLATPSSRMVNLSTRGQVQAGDNVMIGGFIIQGDSPQTVLIRAVGPNLANYGVTGVLADPMLELRRSSDGAIIGSNDNWGDAANAAAIQATGLAPVDAKESAILTTLQPGAYTAIVSGSGGGTGVGIVEVYAQ